MFPKFNQEAFVVNAENKELDIYRKSGEDFINSHRRLLSSFAEDVSIKFKMSDAFKIEFETGVVNLDSKWFFEKGYNKEQILWATFHELSHFRDLAQDKDGLLESFKYIQQKAATLAKESGMTPDLAYKTYHTLFNCLDDIYVNKVVSRRASFYEKGRQGGKHVEGLYKEKLFKDTDFTNEDAGSSIPNHLQFAFYLLRKAMLPEQEITVSDEVRRALDTEILIEGKQYTPKELIETFMLPSSQRDTKASVRHTYLKKYIEPIYESLIESDIEDSKNPDDNEENNEPPSDQGQNKEQQGEGENESSENDGTQKTEQPQDGQPGEERPQDKENDGSSKDNNETGSSQEENKSGADNASSKSAESESGEPAKEGKNKNEGSNAKERAFKKWSDIHETFEFNSPDQLDEKEIEKFIDHQEDKKKEEIQKNEEEAKKSEERRNNMQAFADKDWAEKHGIEGRDILRELQSLRKIEDSIMPYLNSLTELWQNIIAGNSLEINYAKDSMHASGSELNINSVIDNIGALYAGQASPRIYDRITAKDSLVEKPEVIRLRLVVDKSGSMDDESKQKVLAQSLVLILRSLQQFNEMLSLTRGSTGSKLKIETQVLGFSSGLSIIKKLESEEGQEVDPTIGILNTLRGSGPDRGNTYDNLALDYVLDTQDELGKQKIKQGKVLDILFEITDGGSSNEDSSRDAVNKMDETGIHTNAFQIGKVDSSEKRTFNNVWNNGDNKRGLIVGFDIGELLPAVTEALKKHLSGVRM